MCIYTYIYIYIYYIYIYIYIYIYVEREREMVDFGKPEKINGFKYYQLLFAHS